MGPKTEFAQDIITTKYCEKGESYEQMIHRVARALSDNDFHYRKLFEILGSQRFLTGGRIMAAMGSRRNLTAMNCFVSGVIEDSLAGIMQAATNAAHTMQAGGGIGYDFSTIRPRGTPISTLGSQASGPVSFMEIFNGVCKSIASAGHRRGAQMGILRVDHPDIFEFVRAKQNTHNLTAFNVSIAVTDDFMRAVRDGTPFDLKWEGQVARTVDARKLWAEVMQSTYDWAEPGIFFVDTANRMNNIAYCETIAATNPCILPGTLIVTASGLYPIETLVGKNVTIHTGTKWQTINNFRITGTNRPSLKIELQDGSLIHVTPNHTMILDDGERIEAKDLEVGDKLQINNVEFSGPWVEEDAYLKGFLLGDGTNVSDTKTCLKLYPPKYVCESRLGLAFTQENGRRHSPIDNKFHPWVSTYKSALPLDIYNWSLESKAEFLAGFFDSDGCALDTANGFSYQISAVSKNLLLDLQTLLKTIGVQSKVALMRSAEWRDMPGGHYYCQDCWRLSIAQESSVKLASLVKFERLVSFANKKTSYKVKPRFNTVVAITDNGIADTVYCCTVEGEHSITLSNHIVVGQCAEICMGPDSACLLGSFNLTAYLMRAGGHVSFNWSQFCQDIPHIVRALDNVNDRTNYPLPAQRAMALAKRRLGIGVTGLANALELQGHPYGDQEFIWNTSEIFKLLAHESYEASAYLAREKGTFPLYNTEKFSQSEFVAKLFPNTRKLIASHGMRNSHLMAVAPTGTISLSADNVSGGIEPVFAHSVKRTVQTFDGPKQVDLNDWAYGNYGHKGKTASATTVDQHLGVMAAAQNWTDQAISKTVNIPRDYPFDDFAKVYMRAWEMGLKGIATYRSGGKREAVLIEKPPADEAEGLACFFDPATGKKTCD